MKVIRRKALEQFSALTIFVGEADLFRGVWVSGMKVWIND